MLHLIKKIITKTAGQEPTRVETREEAHIALCVLLLEAAHSDGECSDAEMDHLVATLTTEYGVARQEIDELIAASRHERSDAIDLFRFTRYMNNHYSKEEKIAVMEAVWRIIHIDALLDAHEDHFAHKVANLLRLSHKELIDAKIKARTQLN